MQHAIVFLDRESVDAKVRRPNFPHSYKEYQSTWTPEEIVERLKDADHRHHQQGADARATR